MTEDLAERHLHDWISTIGLDIEYVRAAGNKLYYLGEDGQEKSVIDYAGGYAALLLGHNHPEIVQHARTLLDSQRPVLAQFSRQTYANRLAAELNRIVQREHGDDEPYAAVFANSGAEAVEVAIKHAELDRVMRASALAERIAAHVEEARSAIARGDATVGRSVHDKLGTARASDSFDAVVAEIDTTLRARLGRPPILFALQGSFHGKLIGSLQVTHNEEYRSPFRALAVEGRFVPVNNDELAEHIERERTTVFDVVVAEGLVEVVEVPFPSIGAFLVEPIQGEGGIVALTEDFAGELQHLCGAAGVPIIVDEIQSGMGRTGTFLASTGIGLRGDYYALAKSLGGGLAKAAVVLVRRGRYRPEFEFVHSSTFAKDRFSCSIALKTLEILEADDGHAYRLAAAAGKRLSAVLNDLRDMFPDVVKDVRGTGLMLGLEFHSQVDVPSEPIRERARAGILGYVIAGYLLREHGIRIFPTASATNTLRFEPSLYLTDDELDQLGPALRDVCATLAAQDGQRLTKHEQRAR